MIGTAVAPHLRMGVSRYEDLECWQLANELKLQVYALVNNSLARHDLKFRDQIFDSARSGLRNIAEGFARYDHPEFAHFLGIAKASIAETHNHIGTATTSDIGPQKNGIGSKLSLIERPTQPQG